MKAVLERSFFVDSLIYLSRIRHFKSEDWIVYFLWVGLMWSLFATLASFTFFGWSQGAEFPTYVWNIPLGAFIFFAAIAFDTIGHRTVYKQALRQGEALVHHITIFAGIASVVALVAAYRHPVVMKIPALVLIGLSVFYSLVDEALHWHRYLTKNSDRVEMWSHFFILSGHLLMILSWWQWYMDGYPGVSQTLAFFRFEL